MLRSRILVSLRLPLAAIGLAIAPPAALAQEDPFAATIRPTQALSPQEEQQALHVPAGFRISLFASEPDIPKPINMAFDGQGRLWVSGSNDYPFPNLNQPGDRICILEDRDQDGRSEQVSTFVDQITIPIGLYPYRDGVIAFSIPNIWFFRDTDGDGQCDQRQVLFGPFDYSKDTHGLNNAFRRGFDGWIYACHGFNNHSVVTGPDGNTMDLASGNTYRFRPDGAWIEQFTWGQVNPFGMTMDPQGDLFSSDCHSKPIMLLLREGQYPGFGRLHDGLGFVPPVMKHSHGSTAICGLTQYTGTQFPEEYRGDFFVGNVMTSRVNRDKPKYSGSSISVEEQSDFVTSDDPWFRPVDMQVGPDGALYIADFYNKIIGHYEVPLTHEDRDRRRGRIWRVEYVGEEGQASVAAPRLVLSQTATADLIDALGSDTLPQRMRALDELTDQRGRDGIPQLLQRLDEHPDALVRIGLLWALQRQGELPNDRLLDAVAATELLVRIHALRILADRADWTNPLHAAAIAGLADPAPLVQRAAAEALARHPDETNIRPLLERMTQVPAEDVHLLHQLKIALRNQLRLPGMISLARSLDLGKRQRDALTSACQGVDSREAAAYLLEQFGDPGFVPDQAVPLVERIARWSPPMDWARLIHLLRNRCGDDLELQLQYVKAIRQGLRQQGATDVEPLQHWAEQLLQDILQKTLHDEAGWNSPAEARQARVPWDLERRASADNLIPQPFLSSLPGGERATGTMRSPEFVIPQEMNLSVCGHLGPPKAPPDERNLARVCLAESGEEIARVLAPRKDIAQRVKWNLSLWSGQKGYLEVVDGLDLPSYAWIAIGRIEPPVISLPTVGPQTRARLLKAAAALSTDFHLDSARGGLEELVRASSPDFETRAAAAQALAQLHGSVVSLGAATLLGTAGLSSAQQAEAETLLLEGSDEAARQQRFRELIKGLPLRAQTDVALGLLTDRGGADLLLNLMESGMISAQTLENPLLRAGLSAAQLPDAQARVEALAGVVSESSAERNKRIGALQKLHAKHPGSTERGQRVFETRCSACHQLRGQGKVIGPQLDGIGNRGTERLLEDIVDPNRNVDVAFRSRSYALSSGKIYAGIFRRTEGQLVVIANNKGEEQSFPSGEIEQELASAVSIMPDNWGETLPDQELLDLLAYLLEQRK